MAFREALIAVYGEENVDVDSGDRIGERSSPFNRDFDAWGREARAALERRTSWPQVVTGHFWFGKYEAYRSSAYTILWLREPAARLISAYFYLRSEHRTRGPGANAVSRGEVSIEEFMEMDWHSNPITRRLLRGYDAHDFDFIGIQEHFAEDLGELGGLLGWPKVETSSSNSTSTAEYLKFRPSEALVRKIRALNDADVELYERALELRRARRAARAEVAL